MPDIAHLTRRMRNFTEARDWARFHDPKSLALALVGEVGELAELLQWIRHEDQATVVRERPLREQLAEEMSDDLLRLADVVSVDLAEAAAASCDRTRSASRCIVTRAWRHEKRDRGRRSVTARLGPSSSA